METITMTRAELVNLIQSLEGRVKELQQIIDEQAEDIALGDRRIDELTDRLLKSELKGNRDDDRVLKIARGLLEFSVGSSDSQIRYPSQALDMAEELVSEHRRRISERQTEPVDEREAKTAEAVKWTNLAAVREGACAEAVAKKVDLSKTKWEQRLGQCDVCGEDEVATTKFSGTSPRSLAHLWICTGCCECGATEF